VIFDIRLIMSKNNLFYIFMFILRNIKIILNFFVLRGLALVEIINGVWVVFLKDDDIKSYCHFQDS
jgi:hypothetical protein